MPSRTQSFFRFILMTKLTVHRVVSRIGSEAEAADARSKRCGGPWRICTSPTCESE
jgi:hypothetical protein